MGAAEPPTVQPERTQKMKHVSRSTKHNQKLFYDAKKLVKLGPSAVDAAVTHSKQIIKSVALECKHPDSAAVMSWKLRNAVRVSIVASCLIDDNAVHNWIAFVERLLKQSAGDIKFKLDIRASLLMQAKLALDDDDTCYVETCGVNATYTDVDKKRLGLARGLFRSVCHSVSLLCSILFDGTIDASHYDAASFGWPLACPLEDTTKLDHRGFRTVGHSIVDRAWSGRQ